MRASPCDKQILLDLLLRWEELYEQGKELLPRDLCPTDRPDLLSQLVDGISRLKAAAWLDKPPQGSSDSQSNHKTGDRPYPGYQLERMVGAGAFGEVWSMGREDGLNVKLAIKFLGGKANDPDGERIQMERRGLELMASVSHVRVIRIHEILAVDGETAVVTEFADGGDLASDSGRSLDRFDCLTQLQYAAEALDYIRDELGLQHGDVKPQNLLLVGNKVKLGDFGTVVTISGKPGAQYRQIDRFLSAFQMGPTVYTAAGAFTARYSPPEGFWGSINRHFDQYSLALTFCDLAYGRLPFVENTTNNLDERLKGKFDSTFMLQGIRPVIEKALAPRPQDRYESCMELISRLQDAVGRRGYQGNNGVIQSLWKSKEAKQGDVSATDAARLGLNQHHIDVWNGSLVSAPSCYRYVWNQESKKVVHNPNYREGFV
jgi:serine/threonine-protein kinase